MGRHIAALGLGTTISAFSSRTGSAAWVTRLAGFPAGSQVVSVRVWPGQVTAGVDLPGKGRHPGTRREVVLAAATGHQGRSFPAAPFGGAVAVGAGNTVIVGNTAVTSYSDRTGKPLWRKTTGEVGQAWQVDEGDLYVTVSAGGYLKGGPVRALRKINLRTGSESIIRPAGSSFSGVLSRAFRGVVIFTSARGATAYSATSGARLWHRDGAVPENVDTAARIVYLTDGSALVGVDPQTGQKRAHVSGGSGAGPSGLYAIKGGVALGLDQGALGDAWGYGVASGQVLWTSRSLPWPHYFVDLSGIGGSASPTGGGVLLAICAQVGATAPGGSAPSCSRPELAVVNR
jgi:hypothetical protein